MARPVDQASDDLPSVDLEVIIRTEVKHTLGSHGVDERGIRARLYAVLHHSMMVDLMKLFLPEDLFTLQKLFLSLKIK